MSGASNPVSPPPPSVRFRLHGRTKRVDPRITAARPDIADIALAGHLFAPHYARPLPRMCRLPSAPLHAYPDRAAPVVSELLMGEGFDVLDVSGGWAWGYCVADRYVGYVPEACLGEVAATAWVVTARTALVFATADIKSPLLGCWPLGARFAGVAAGRFIETGAGYVHLAHAGAAADIAPDPVAVAERLLGAPYRWGGRGGDGIDCSGLVQVALGMAGIAAPRDSDQQGAALGIALPEDAALQRGDLVFFPGHVGMMADGARLIHANAHAMAVTVEPLADVIGRLGTEQARPAIARRRIG